MSSNSLDLCIHSFMHLKLYIEHICTLGAGNTAVNANKLRSLTQLTFQRKEIKNTKTKKVSVVLTNARKNKKTL